MAGQTTLRGMAGAPAAGSGANPGATGGTGGDDPGADDPNPANIDPKKLYNQVQMFTRLMAKKDKELEALKSQLGEYEPMRKTMSSLRTAFGAGEPPLVAGEPEPTAYELAQRAHQRSLDADPEGGGIPLTLHTAKESSEAYKLVKEQAKAIEDLTAKLKQASSPMYAAERVTFVNIDNGLREAVESLYGDQKIADENFAGFEQAAIVKLQEMQKDQRVWRAFLANPTRQQQFVKDIITGRMPRAWGPRGSSSLVEDYTYEQAAADLQRAEKMKMGPDRDKIQTKARRRLLPEMLGVDIRPTR